MWPADGAVVSNLAGETQYLFVLHALSYYMYCLNLIKLSVTQNATIHFQLDFDLKKTTKKLIFKLIPWYSEELARAAAGC